MERQQDRVPGTAPSGPSPSDPSSDPTSPPLTVKFLPQPSVKIIESRRRPVTMVKREYENFARDQVTDAMLDEAAELFSENYGTWGEHSHSPGTPVKLTGRRLREQYLPDSSTSYIKVTVDGILAGNAFVCRWKQNGNSVCWITQLVVDRDYRERGLASGLLGSLQSDADNIYGIMSSHPAACLATASSLGTNIEKVPLNFIKENAEAIMKASPIPYIREAKLRGSLFEPDDSTGLVCGANTRFFVDHEEPLEALQIVRETWDWPLGDLPDGHEYLLLLPGRRRRSKSHTLKRERDVGR